MAHVRTMNEVDPIEVEILRLNTERGIGKSICPSEVARALDATEWQKLMGQIRQAAIRLARAGRIDMLRKGKPAPPADARGVIRLRFRHAGEILP